MSGPRNRPQRKGKKEKKIVIHKHSFEGGITEVLDRLNAFTKEWAEKHNLSNQELVQLRQAVIIQFGHVESNHRIFAESLDRIDTNVLSFAKVLRNIYGQLEQTEEFLKVIMDKLDLNPAELPLNLDEIRERAEAMCRTAIAGAFAEVREEKAAHEAARKQAEELQREQAEKNADEAKRAEEELKAAETPQLDPLAGGQGADIPEGAQVFGE